MSRLLTLQEIMESDSIDLLRIYYGDLTLQSKKIDNMLNERLPRAYGGRFRKVQGPMRPVSPFSKKEVPMIKTSPLSSDPGAGAKARNMGLKTGTSAAQGSTGTPPPSPPITPEGAKQVAQSGTPQQKEDFLQQMIRMKMTGDLLDGEFGSMVKYMGAQWVLSNLGGVAAGLGLGTTAIAAIQLIVASVAGVGVGYAVNKALYDDFEGEALERIKKAMADEQYAKAELDLYCRGTGKLCSSQGGPTKCISKSKSSKNPFVGGYRYETAGSERLGRVLTPGSIGDGREKSTEAQRKIDDVGKDLAKKYGTAGALAGSALATLGTPVFLGSKIAAKISGDTGNLVVYVQQPAFDSRDLAVIAGIGNVIVHKDILNKKIKYDPKTKKMEVGSGATIKKYENCIKMLLNSGFAQRSLAQYSWLKGNYGFLQLALGLKTFPELKKIRKVDQKKGKKKDEKPFTPVGPTNKTNKCNNFPMNVGCKGKQVATTLGILLRGTEFGKEQFASDRQKFTDFFNKQEYTPELKNFFEQAVSSITPEEMQTYTDNIKIMGIEEDPVTDTPQKIASDFAKANGQITSGNQFDMLLGKLAAANNIKLNEKLRDLFTLRSLIYEVLEEQELLTEGGAGGHMRHPFDLDDVKTGEDLVKKFEQIASEIKAGNKPDTKIDGVNTSIKVVATPQGKEFAMDRGSSKSIDVEGITVDRLPERFNPGHGMIKAGENVLGIFNDALSDISPELEQLGMLDDPTKFFNMEYVKGTTNVLAYDHDFLKIHGVNQFYEKKNRKGQPVRPGLERPIDPETNKAIKDPSVPVAYDQKVMDSLVEKLNKYADKYGFKVYSSIPSTSTGDFDFSPVMNVPVPVTYSTGDVREETLGDRLKAAENRIGETVNTIDGRKPPAQGKEIYKAVLGASAADTNADPERQVPLDELLASDEDYQRAIDGAVFWHGTRLLGNVIMNNMVVDHPAVSGPATEHEGLVIRLSGDDFDTKITGEFILGGEATSFRAAEPEAAKEVKAKNIAIFPGSFKPPHKGHLSIIERIAKNPEVDEIKVIISAPGKKVRSPKITPEKAKAIFEKFISAANISKPVSVEIASQPSPIGAAYEYIGEKAGPNENIMLLTSEADAKRYPQAVLDKAVASNKNADTVTARGFVLPVCRDEGCDTTEKVSATTIRNIVDVYPDITLDELTKAVDHMPDSMSTADKLATFEMLVDDSLSNKFEDEELNTLNESVRFIMETIDKALDIVLLTEKVRKTKGKEEYCVVSKNKKTKEGKLRTYGCYRSRKAANKRLGQVEGFKARAMAEGEELEEYQIVEMSSMSGGNVQGYAGGNKNQFSLIREED